jgi:hypothetical protein
MSNVEQGISNDEVKSLLFFPSAFFIRYSTCPLCPQTHFIWIQRACGYYGFPCAAKYFAGQAGILRFAFDLLRSLRRSDRLRFQDSENPSRP